MIIIRDISCKASDNESKRMHTIRSRCTSLLRVDDDAIKDIEIIKKSIDARKKPEILYNINVLVTLDNEKDVLKRCKSSKVSKYDPVIYKPIKCDKKDEIYVIGAGPAGLFCALVLARSGLRPIVVERGAQVESRIEDVNKFWQTGVLNPESNVQFGEGGAGTFSDGKLNSGVKDRFGLKRYILKTFVEFGADENILIDAMPHIGTDVLVNVVSNMRKEIIELGGKFLFNTRLDKINHRFNKIKSIELSGYQEGIIDTKNLVLAIGHSARDTFYMLYDEGLSMTAKNFAVGLRIEHLQDMINKSQYGRTYMDRYPDLPAATYKVTANFGGRSVFSFCMCPGGYVINASSQQGGIAINGMSNATRNSYNANSAIVVSVGAGEYDMTDPIAAINYQRSLEKKAYALGSGNIPIQLYKDFRRNASSTALGSVKPVGGCKRTLANLRELFPDDINNAIVSAIELFDKRIEGFACPDALLSGVESRTSSPIRILRDDRYMSSIEGIYPCGEGAGYAGGIMSAAMDGIRTAEQIITRINNS